MLISLTGIAAGFQVLLDPFLLGSVARFHVGLELSYERIKPINDQIAELCNR